MAKQQKEEALVPTPSEDALVAAAPDQMPSFIPQGDLAGRDNISVQDARVPRLVLATTGTPQAKRGDPRYLEDLVEGVSFNDLTNEIYGGDPLDVIFVRADPPRWVLFDKDRTVINPRVEPGDPLTQFTTVDGKRVPPQATCFFDYIVLLGKKLEPLALSFKGSGIKLSAKPLNGLILMKPVPIYSQIYRLTPKYQSNDKGSWWAYIPKQVGFIADEATFKKAEEYFRIFKNKEVVFDQTPDKDGPGPDDEGAEKEL